MTVPNIACIEDGGETSTRSYGRCAERAAPRPLDSSHLYEHSRLAFPSRSPHSLELPLSPTVPRLPTAVRRLSATRPPSRHSCPSGPCPSCCQAGRQRSFASHQLLHMGHVNTVAAACAWEALILSRLARAQPSPPFMSKRREFSTGSSAWVACCDHESPIGRSRSRDDGGSCRPLP